MRNRQYKSPREVGFVAKATTGEGNFINVTDFRNADFSLGTAGNANCTIKVKGGLGDDCPNFSAAASATNRWSFIDIALLNNAGVITDGDTGVVFTGTDGDVVFEVNTNGLDWITLSITAISAGSVTADATLTTNE